MSRILLSWLAYNNDFKQGIVDTTGPTYTFHKKFFDYDKHIILSAAAAEDSRLDWLVNTLKRDFVNRTVEGRYMNISSIIDLKEIYGKVQPLLLSYKYDEITIFISPGTPTMQVAWYLSHMNLGLNTTLVQTIPGNRLSAKNNAELVHIDVEKSLVPTAALIKEQTSATSDDSEDYKITNSIRPIYQKALKIAEAEKVTVLIMGDSGTGKEHLAKYIHENSPRSSKPFLTINCSAFSDSLLESRLFGYKKGAFTDARADTKGIFEQADTGTIFLDEIGDISPYMQQSLLRVIHQKEITPIGGISKKVDVRIITATNKDLIKECTQDKFRWDLYYRLATVEIKLPSLLERGQREIKDLVEYFLRSKKKVFGRSKPIQIDATVKQILADYHWPGNVRELENVIEGLYVFTENFAHKDSLPSRLTDAQLTMPLKWENVERQLIEKVLTICKGNQNKAAETIGYAINTLRSKMKKYKIDPISFK